MKIKGNNIEAIHCDMINVNYDFIRTFGIKLIKGRDLNEANFPLQRNYCLISKSTVDAFNLKEPIGKTISILDGEMYTEIVGVVEDFYVTSFYKQPKPIVLTLDVDFINGYYIQLSHNANKAESIEWIKKVWDEVFPDTNFIYSFYKDGYESLYKSVYSTVKMVIVFSLFALFLSVICLYGMSNHISSQRVKEVSLRRLFGATAKENFNTMIKSFFSLILVCNILAIPVSLIVSYYWLKQFSYHASFSYMNVVYTFLLSLFILLLAISSNILRTVYQPIVKVLKENQ
jgi:ABC-type antimicrobial peptide transport system permease subunit